MPSTATTEPRHTISMRVCLYTGCVLGFEVKPSAVRDASRIAEVVAMLERQ
jgi:hypothetical protein